MTKKKIRSPGDRAWGACRLFEQGRPSRSGQRAILISSKDLGDRTAHCTDDSEARSTSTSTSTLRHIVDTVNAVDTAEPRRRGTALRLKAVLGLGHPVSQFFRVI